MNTNFIITQSEFNYDDYSLYNDLLYLCDTKEEADAKMETVHNELLNEFADTNQNLLIDDYEPACDEFTLNYDDSIIILVKMHQA